ncbi:MAG: calcium/proton exchanger [SAR324 cluster bacterium]|uniref:Ca(2+)/H(+) antiporter n=1 Tax=SAR324 cluster bacterium TaxID=2024889 RepID=A0A7X9IJD0_9DELT|nr:calcium/proton exchanger [SAR324 cluster bacterium]
MQEKNSYGLLDLFLITIPAVLFAKYLFHASGTIIFILACISIVPLAKWLGIATERIAEKGGEGVGGLLNATFGNAAELIIAGVAMRDGLSEVVKASLTGSIIGNILLVMGASFIAGGSRHKIQNFSVAGVHSQTSMLMLATISLIIPALFHFIALNSYSLSPLLNSERNISLDISAVLLLVYGFSLLFSLKTHKQLFSVVIEREDTESPPRNTWSIKKSLSILFISTIFITWMSELLVGSIKPAAEALGMSGLFIGVIVVAIVGNAAEHSTAVVAALKNRMDLSLGIAIGSSTQITLFVAPILVFLSYLIGPQPLDLVFSISEVIAIALSVLIASQVTGDGQSNWFEGVQLIAVYLILAVMFYYLPVSGSGVAPPN